MIWIQTAPIGSHRAMGIIVLAHSRLCPVWNRVQLASRRSLATLNAPIEAKSASLWTKIGTNPCLVVSTPHLHLHSGFAFR